MFKTRKFPTSSPLGLVEKVERRKSDGRGVTDPHLDGSSVTVRRSYPPTKAEGLLFPQQRKTNRTARGGKCCRKPYVERQRSLTRVGRRDWLKERTVEQTMLAWREAIVDYFLPVSPSLDLEQRLVARFSEEGSREIAKKFWAKVERGECGVANSLSTTER